MRLFVASFLAADNLAFYDDRISALADRHSIVKAIPRRSAHLTHAFLGEVGDSSINDILAGLVEAVRPRRRFEIELGPPDILYAGRDARLVCAHVTRGERELVEMAREIIVRLRQRPGLADLKGAKAPHVTLARFRKGVTRANARSVSDALAQQAAVWETLADAISSVQLVRSELTPGGPFYQAIGSAPLTY